MIKKNILAYLLIVGCCNAVHSAFPEWVKWAYKEGGLKSSAELTISLVGMAAQLPFGKKFFGLDEVTAINLENQKIQMHNYMIQLITNLRSLMTNEYYKNLSAYDQLAAYHLSLNTAHVSRHTLLIR